MRPFRCGECPGTVDMRSGKGLKRELLPGLVLPLPEELEVPRCDTCGEAYYRPEDAIVVASELEERYQRERIPHAQRLIALLCARHKINVYQLESACGMVIPTLTEVKAGRGHLSFTEERLLEAFEVCPNELRRHLGLRN